MEYEALIGSDFAELKDMITSSAEDVQSMAPDNFVVYPRSRRIAEGLIFLSIRGEDNDYLLILDPNGTTGHKILNRFIGDLREKDGTSLLFCVQNIENAELIKSLFPVTAPVSIGSDRSSFGVGDRLGFASPGHIPLFIDGEIVPVLAQQSLRELDLMGRTYRDVVAAAVWAVFNTGYSGDWVADGDHLKENNAVISALEQGCTMITADLSDHLAFEYISENIQTVGDAYSRLDPMLRKTWEARYTGEIIMKSGTVLNFNEETLRRTALAYGRAVEHAEKLFRACRSVRYEFDFEISIDETDLPTTPEAHYFVAEELRRRDIGFTSLAPRFVGEFQKGIDYIGDIGDFSKTFSVHTAIAADLGYKISIHSSSDKFSVYPIIGRLVKGAYHLKTSGTNWLVALETIAVADQVFFRELFTAAYRVFPAARAYYHITPDLEISTDIGKLEDKELQQVFRNDTDRQVMHVSYGELFKDTDLKRRFNQWMRNHLDEYWAALSRHIGRHLQTLAS